MADSQKIEQGISDRPPTESTLLRFVQRELAPVLRGLRREWNDGVGASDALQAPTAKGQLLVAVEQADGSLRWERLAPGTVGQVLTMGVGGSPVWA